MPHHPSVEQNPGSPTDREPNSTTLVQIQTPLLTMKCKEYGFVDFKVPVVVEAAVKALQIKVYRLK